MSNVLNPTKFTITDPSATKDGVTGFNVKLGTKSGQYTLIAPVPSKDLTSIAAGQVTGPLTDLNQQLANGTWFAVATAINPQGESIASPEFIFDIQGVPSPPTSFTLA